MNDDTKRIIASSSVPRGVLIWLIAAPDNETVSFIDRITTFFSRIVMVLIILAVAVTFYEVVSRYVFQSPTLWANEMTLWAGSIIFLTAGVFAMQRRSHIRITAVYDLMPRRLQVACDFVSALVVVAYAAIMIYASFNIVLKTFLAWERFGTFWNPPIPATIKPLVLIATLLVALQAVNNFILDSRRKNTGAASTEDGP